MTKESKFKQRVRDRMERTGESYATARRNENEAAGLIEEMKAVDAELSELEKAQLEREKVNRQWVKDNPGLKVVTLTLTHNEHGTPTIHVSGPELTSIQITQPPDVYVEAIRQAYQDNEWAKNPKDDLGDLPECRLEDSKRKEDFVYESGPAPEGTIHEDFDALVAALYKVKGRVMSVDHPNHGLVGFVETETDKYHWIRIKPTLAWTETVAWEHRELWGLMQTPRGRCKAAGLFSQEEMLAKVSSALEGWWKSASPFPTNPDPAEIVAPLSGEALADVFAHVEKFDVSVEAIVMSARSFHEVCKHASDSIRLETRARLMKKGLMGRLWDALVITTREIDEDEICFLGRDPEGKWVCHSLRVIRPSAQGSE